MHAQDGSAAAAKLELVPVTRANYIEVFDLAVSPEQRDFVADTAFSLVQAAYEPHWEPYAIVANAEVVGFIMGGIIAPGVYEISRLLIDQNEQRRGYGGAALEQFLAMIRSRTEIDVIKTSYIPFNAKAPGFYRRFGFHETAERWQQEIVMALPLRRREEN